MKLYSYIDAIHILSTGYLFLHLITPSQLNGMITQVKKTVVKTKHEYDLVIKRLHLYYDMKLVTFGIDGNSDIIVQFPVFVFTLKLVTIYIISNRNCHSPCNGSRYNC